MSISLAGARAEASRRNGARSRGPVTAAGKARSARNALKHGFRSLRFVLLDDERPKAFDALAAGLAGALAPEDALQRFLADRLVLAAWRLERAERIESELFEVQGERGGRESLRLGMALIRDGHGPRAFDTLLRYRGSCAAELWRSLRALKALQAEAAAQASIEMPNEPRPAQNLP